VTPAVPVTGPLVGVSAVVVRGGLVVVGRRRGSHGAGSWAFPGGKVEPGEDPRDVVVRELDEETGLRAVRVEPIAWTSDLLTHGEDTLHFITLHHLVEVAPGEPVVREADKVEDWRWVAYDDIPEPVFAPAASLLATGWRPQGLPRRGPPGG
jgi:8-oxo-dGTP diphosphatase